MQTGNGPRAAEFPVILKQPHDTWKLASFGLANSGRHWCWAPQASADSRSVQSRSSLVPSSSHPRKLSEAGHKFAEVGVMCVQRLSKAFRSMQRTPA